METIPRFSQLYLERGEPTKDSIRFRMRLKAFHDNHLQGRWKVIDAFVREQLGVSFGVRPDLYSFFFKDAETRDILDSVTITYVALNSFPAQYPDLPTMWKQHVQRALIEENMGYRIDANCVIHYHVDEEFERNRVSTLSVLDQSIYAAVLHAYNEAYRHMDHPINTKAAVRSMFEAIEILAKQMTGSSNLNEWLLVNHKSQLKEICRSTYDGQTNSDVVTGMFESFGTWVTTMHKYRHGQTDLDLVVPSEEVAVYILSSGSAFLRWLAQIDTRRSEAR